MARIAHRGRRQLVVVAMLVLAGCVAGSFLARRVLSPGTLNQASAAYARGDWVAATTLAKSRLATAPRDREALRLLARCAARQRHDAVARARYANLGGASAMEAEDFYLMGAILERSGDARTARECWTQGLLADPSHPELIEQFARLSLQDAQPIRAASLARTLGTRPGWQARGGLLLGEIESRLNEPVRAADTLRQALNRDPNAREAPHSPAWYRTRLARSLLQSGQYPEAASTLRKLVSIEPGPEAFWLLSRAHLQAGSVAEADAALSRSGLYRDQDPSAPDPAPFVGAARCAGCHPAIHKAEQNSLHARTFQHARDFQGSGLPATPIIDPARPEVGHSVRRSAGDLQYEVHQGDSTVRAVVEYVFGSGNHGYTLVGHDAEGRVREFRLSHYSDGGGVWDLTTGHPRQPPAGEDFLGRRLSADDLRNCLLCHTTVARSNRDNPGASTADRGIGCESCHGPGGNHLKAIALHFSDPAIARPRLASAAQIVALCGRCHSPLGRSIARDDPFAVRFPAMGLTWSRCYTESRGRLDCRTCHDPHRDVETSASFYESKCLACHSAKPGMVACPERPERDCLSCHMPSVPNVVPHSTFTNHHIQTRPAMPRRK